MRRMVRLFCFNLAIEILFFSRLLFSVSVGDPDLWFQSRNRDTFLFKRADFRVKDTAHTQFQSRNRDTFLFKPDLWVFYWNNHSSFNLAIEILFFSREIPLWVVRGAVHLAFQSRNRDTFLFKGRLDTRSFVVDYDKVSISQSRYFSFQEGLANETKRFSKRFNLVIEILFFSRLPLSMLKW